MKILHVMRREKFTESVSDFYNRFFNNGEHVLCFVNKQGLSSMIRDDLEIEQKEVFFSDNQMENVLKFKNAFTPYDYIVFHSLFFSNWIKSFLALHPNLLKKMVWIEWGGDLYSWKTRSAWVKAWPLNWINRYLREHCDSVVCIFPPDCDHYREEFPSSKAKLYYAPYCGGEIPKEYLNYSSYSRLKDSREKEETIYIQVGHSAAPTIDHICTLKALERFSDKNIKILLPLSYGNAEYGESVQKYAEDHFPGKVLLLKQMLPKEEYFNVINRVDIAIFHTFRQIALGNINRLLFRNVKLYLPGNSVMYKYFMQLGAPVQKTEDLESCSFEEFISDAVVVNEDNFKTFINSYSDMDAQKNYWKMIYDDMRIRLSN